MNYSLLAHERGYHISHEDVFASLKHGFSGAPYALRHREMFYECDKPYMKGHWIIAQIESLPILGALAALIERVVVKVFTKVSHFLQKNIEKAISLEDGIKKMHVNAAKAIQEHLKRKNGDEPFATLQEGLPPIEAVITPKVLTPLTFSYTHDDDIGHREQMEDAHFIYEFDAGLLAGIFDGHGGTSVANFASNHFLRRFENKLKMANGDIRKVFIDLLKEINKEILENGLYDFVGSTAVINFINKKSHLIYTATIADSESSIYRKIDSQIKTIPLSVIRDWSSPKDAQRAEISLEKVGLAKKWTATKNAKELRFPFPTNGVNVSRALGDKVLTVYNQKPGVIAKPKISINQVKPGDCIILGCDGLRDYVNEEEIAALLTKFGKDKNVDLAEKLVDYALDDKDTKDNVTVICIKVE